MDISDHEWERHVGTAVATSAQGDSPPDRLDKQENNLEDRLLTQKKFCKIKHRGRTISIRLKVCANLTKTVLAHKILQD